MTEKHDFDAFAREQLEETVDGMDGSTRSRLASMRHEAMDSLHTRRRGWLLPVSALTAMTAVALLVWMAPQQQSPVDVDTAAMEDMDLLASDVEMDLLENVEFYQWLEDNEHAG